jgi:hypothetical protein
MPVVWTFGISLDSPWALQLSRTVHVAVRPVHASVALHCTELSVPSN